MKWKLVIPRELGLEVKWRFYELAGGCGYCPQMFLFASYCGLGVRNSDFPAFTPTPCKLYPSLWVSLYWHHQLSFYKNGKRKVRNVALAYNPSILGNKGRNITRSLRSAWFTKGVWGHLGIHSKTCLHRKDGRMEGEKKGRQEEREWQREGGTNRGGEKEVPDVMAQTCWTIQEAPRLCSKTGSQKQNRTAGYDSLCAATTLTPGRLKQKHCKFKFSLGYKAL